MRKVKAASSGYRFKRYKALLGDKAGESLGYALLGALIGAVLLLIPVVGWIAGGFVLLGAFAHLVKAFGTPLLSLFSAFGPAEQSLKKSKEDNTYTDFECPACQKSMASWKLRRIWFWPDEKDSVARCTNCNAISYRFGNQLLWIPHPHVSVTGNLREFLLSVEDISRTQVKPGPDPEDSRHLAVRVQKVETPKGSRRRLPQPLKVFIGCCFGAVIGVFVPWQLSKPVGSLGATEGASPLGKYSTYMSDATYEGAYANFQQLLPKLDHSIPNLRVFPVTAFNPRPDNPQDSQMVSPYGPCASVVGGANGGYVVERDDGYRTVARVFDTIYSDRAAATKVAENYCHRWFASVQPAASQLFWFEPEPESTSDPVAPTPGPDSIPSTAAEEPTPIPTAPLNVSPIDLTPSGTQDPIGSKRLNTEGLRMLSGANPDFGSARSDFERAFQLDSTNVEALNNLGYVYGRLGDYRTAELTLLQVLDMSPTRKAAKGNLGAIEAELGKTQEAADHFCQSIRQSNSLEQGKSNLIRVFKDADSNVQAAIKMTLANCN